MLESTPQRLPHFEPHAPEPVPGQREEVDWEVGFARQYQASKPRATYAIAAVCVLVFLAEELWGGAESPVLWRMGEVQGKAVEHGDWWRLWSATFLHGGLMHVAFNVWSLLQLGKLVEAVLGARRFGVLYALAGMAGSLLGCRVAPEMFSVGASGAIFGLMGAVAALGVRGHGLLPPGVQKRILPSVVSTLVLNVAYSFTPGINMWAHFGGGLLGFVWVASGAGGWGRQPLGHPARAPDRAQPLYGLLMLLCVGGMSASLVAAMVYGRPWALNTPPALVPTTIGGVTVSVPEGLAATEPESAQGWTEQAFGTLSSDPIVVILRAKPLDEPVADEDLPALLESFQTELAAPVQANFRTLKSPEVRTVGGRKVVYFEQKAIGDSRVIRGWAGAAGKALIEVNVLEDRPTEAWHELGDTIAASIR
jgi:membrane associated rhomboid family serine protease